MTRANMFCLKVCVLETATSCHATLVPAVLGRGHPDTQCMGRTGTKKAVVSSEHHASIAFYACCSTTGREFASLLRPNKCPGPSRVQLLW